MSASELPRTLRRERVSASDRMQPSILATGLRTAGPTGALLQHRCSCGLLHVRVTELPTTHHSVQLLI